MATSITVGKARLSTVTLVIGGAVDTTSPITVDSGNHDTLRCRVNPDNPREIAVVGLAESSGVNALISARGFSAASLFQVDAASAPPDGLAFGPWSPEIDPPSWALA